MSRKQADRSSSLRAAPLAKRFQLFIEYQQVPCKKSTLTQYKTGLKHFDAFLKRTFKTDKIQKLHIAKLKKSHLEKYRSFINSKDLAPYTKVNYLLDAKLYLAWEAEQNNLNPRILDALDRKHFPRVPEYLPRPLSAQNDQRLISILRQSRSPYACFFLLLRLNGLRISELINLPWDCVITNDKNEKYLRIPPGKMDLERLVPLSDESAKLVEQIKAIYPVKLNLCDRSRLIGLKAAHLYTHLSKEFKKILGDFTTDQNKPITFHRLRHTYSTSLLAAGVSITSLMKLLGHRRVEMSLRYAKITPSHLRNEYLKAITVMEAHAGLRSSAGQRNISDPIHPAEIINQLYSFTQKSARIDQKQKRVLLQRLARLKNDMKPIVFEQDFEIKSPDPA